MSKLIPIRALFKHIIRSINSIRYLLRNCQQVDLLWTNSKPAASFAPQTIKLDLATYDAVDIIVRRADDQTYDTVHRIFVGSKNRLEAPMGGAMPTSGTGSGTTWSTNRSASVSKTGVTFGTGGYEYLQSGSGNLHANNTYALPLKIYGVRFGVRGGGN